VRTEEVTLPGFKHDLYATRHPLFGISRAYSELEADLRTRGVEYLNTDVPTGVLLPDGRSGILSSDLEISAAEFERLSYGGFFGSRWKQGLGPEMERTATWRRGSPCILVLTRSRDRCSFC
jgi:phytoene dehydrogenase-like protein